ncbi:nucleotidyltransferase family protein [Rubrimonas cliftonensis]|uniref:Nucleotidyltransferase n=1 Tax=Rubrimonas cliftonensis TaxID=89524 RepID=A0A1H4GF03_9RHOB|nr:GSU2403 family nucleotidyltransferase fold protein [Rubrimonas cliftonensis]SEB07282.1 hypothetical protein SAMN05444370_1524 [Rubrimonas cliftonensis]
MIKSHSATGTSAYAELLRLLRDEVVSDIRGAPRLKTINGRGYWYDQHRIGAQTLDRYIGEDGPELRDRLAAAQALRAQSKEAARGRARLMRVLRAEGFRMSDIANGQVVAAMGKVGVFRLGGTLVGTHAFRCYEGELGVRIGFDDAAMTDDIDIASFERLSIVLEDRVDPPLADVFADLRFDPVPSIERGRVWRWRQTERQALVEFLTPSFDAEEGVRDLPALGVSAQSLHFLNYLIAEPIHAAFLYRSGVLVRIPRPERFAIHKLIVSDRRRDGVESIKARKDLAQAAFLIEVLAEERPEDLAEAHEAARASGPAWRKRLDAALRRAPETRAIIDALPG